MRWTVTQFDRIGRWADGLHERLPLLSDKYALHGTRHARCSTMPRSGHRKIVLVVDDDRDVRESVAEALEDAGYEVPQAANGREALAILESMPAAPCLVLLDMMMPEMSGAELLAVLRESPRLATLPVVVCSGHAELAHGAHRLLRKPVSLGLVLAIVEEFCGKP